MKKHIPTIILIILIALIGGGLFYWFQIRPSQIYSACNVQALKDALETAKERPDYPTGDGTWYNQNDYDTSYNLCLRSKGINK